MGAVKDCRDKVLEVLLRFAELDEHVVLLCEFLKEIPTMEEMDRMGWSEMQFRQAVQEIRLRAKKVADDTPKNHALQQLIQIYAGPKREAGEEFGRLATTWVEDFTYTHAWVFPDARRSELGDISRVVAARRSDENIDDVDRVFLAVINLDIPEVIKLLNSMPESFPTYFITHLVDMLYFAGRVPIICDLKSQNPVPPRDWHLMAYAEELCRGPRSLQRLSIDYLRSAGCPQAVRMLELFADHYCGSADTEDEAEEALVLLVDLDFQQRFGVRFCRTRAQTLRARGDVLGCLRWACHAEDFNPVPRGYFVSEILDALSAPPSEGGNLESLLECLTPTNINESLETYPPPSLLELLSLSRLPPSGYLYFFSTLARCRARRLAKQPATVYAPALVHLLADGVVPPRLVETVFKEELWSGLSGQAPALSTDDALLLMRYVRSVTADPLKRVKLPMPEEEAYRLAGHCFSRAVLRGSAKCGSMLSDNAA